MDIRYKKNIKKQLNKSMDYNTYDIRKYNFLEKQIPIQTIPNKNNSINKNDNIDQLKLKIKDLEKKIEEKDKIIEKLQRDKNTFYNKYQFYRNKIQNLESNELRSLKNIIKFDNNKINIGQNINFIILSNKNGENKKKDSEKIKNNEINNLKSQIKSQNKKIGEIEDIIKKNNEELSKLKTENKSINDDLSRIKEENYNLKEEKKRLNLKDLDNNKLVKEKPKKSNLNRSSSQPKMENQFYNISINIYEYPTLIGLNNIGAAYFMNSTLQCLSQTESLTNYFLKEKNLSKIINNNLEKNNIRPQLSPIYLELIKKLWSKEKIISFSPNNFKNIVEIMNPLFKAGQAGDAKGFITFILEQLHKELKQPINSHNNNMNFIQPLNKYDKKNVFFYFMNEFKKECSIISDIFFGFNETSNTCINCKNNFSSNGLYYPIYYNYEIFNCLIFPLEKVIYMRNNQKNFNNNNNNSISLYECFCFNNRNEYLTGENRKYCNYCNQLSDTIYTSKIFVSPNILIIILDRGNIYDAKINSTESIDITQFVIKKDKPKIIYNLYGVITYIRQKGPNPHYVASCKSPIDYRWYRFNDSIVNPINNLQKEVIEFEIPYILFYQKQN